MQPPFASMNNTGPSVKPEKKTLLNTAAVPNLQNPKVRFRSSHRFSTRLGQETGTVTASSILWSLNHFCGNLDACMASLPSWKIQLWTSCGFLAEAGIFAFTVSWYFMVYTKGPLALGGKHQNVPASFFFFFFAFMPSPPLVSVVRKLYFYLIWPWTQFRFPASASKLQMRNFVVRWEKSPTYSFLTSLRFL